MIPLRTYIYSKGFKDCSGFFCVDYIINDYFLFYSLYSSRFVFLQYALDASIVQTVSGSSDTHNFVLKQFPYPNYRKDYFNSTVAGFLPLLLTLAFIYSAMMIVKVGRDVLWIKMLSK